jgi:aminodeoxychorismate lyase
LNDRIVPEEEALVSVFDRGFTYGDGLFETLRAYRGVPFRLDAHLDRMARTASELRLRLPRSPDRIRQDIANVLERNRLEDAVVRMQATRGRGGRGPMIPPDAEPTWVVAAWELPADLESRRARGARLSKVGLRRLDPATLPSGKLANYLNAVLAVAEAADRNCDDGLMLTPGGVLAECGVANLFFVRDGVVSTPSLELGILPGITRAAVLDLAGERGLPTREVSDPPQVLDTSTEVFVTNSLVGIWPVSSIDGRSYVCPGPLTAMLLEAYRETVRAETGGRH